MTNRYYHVCALGESWTICFCLYWLFKKTLWAHLPPRDFGAPPPHHQSPRSLSGHFVADQQWMHLRGIPSATLFPVLPAEIWGSCHMANIPSNTSHNTSVLVVHLSCNIGTLAHGCNTKSLSWVQCKVAPVRQDTNCIPSVGEASWPEYLWKFHQNLQCFGMLWKQLPHLVFSSSL